jgi:leucyl aminopeptidase
MLHAKIQESKISELVVIDFVQIKEIVLPLLEGLSLSNYQFIKYLKDKEKAKFTLSFVHLQSDVINSDDINELVAVCDAVKEARNLVNEPLSFLTAKKLSEEIKRMANESGFTVEVFEKTKIQSLKMGGLLAVNKGSVDEPTFSVLEWKPQNAINSKPVVFVGKGIVYDTGGLSLKPTKDSMDQMKSDMGGAASVVGALYAIAKVKLPIHVVGLIPATDNRPGGNAYAPGDIIKMHNGMSVEVLNTDAEGRLILADALSYAKKYQPEFVIDLATLTGAAAVAIGKYGLVAMGNEESKEKMEQLKIAGNRTFERIVEFPFWEEYGELIKSDIADLKNIGGRDGGAITAGKFLEHFTDYPWVHIDIAGPAFLSSADNYRGKGGTGTGVRLLYDFIKNYQS